MLVSLLRKMTKMNKLIVSVSFFGALLACMLPTAVGQCFSENDNAISESTPSSVTRLLEGYADFAVNLYRSVVQNSVSSTDNVFLSPISVWSALTATYLGSKNQTASELAQVLGFRDADQVGVANAYRVLKIWYYLRTQNEEANYTFKMANKLFFQEEEPVRECMLKHFHSEIKKVNFAQFPEMARTSINKWVEKQTNGKITDLIPPGYVDRTTRMILVNAAYFKGDWENEFDPKGTHEDDFLVQPGHPMNVEMMYQEGLFSFVRNSTLNCAAIELPYSGKELSMFVLLPNQNETIENLVSKLDGKTLQNLVSRMQPTNVGVQLPKFHIEQTLDLKGDIANLGVRDLFDSQNADLSGFTGKADFSINSVLHKTFVEINEEGTEAAAATGLISFRKGTLLQPFTANKPFVFIIRDNILDTILFIGLIRNPEMPKSMI